MKAIFTLAMTTAMTAAVFAEDTEDIPEMAALKDIDVAFLPCNQPYTMTPGNSTPRTGNMYAD